MRYHVFRRKSGNETKVDLSLITLIGFKYQNYTLYIKKNSKTRTCVIDVTVGHT